MKKKGDFAEEEVAVVDPVEMFLTFRSAGSHFVLVQRRTSWGLFGLLPSLSK